MKLARRVALAITVTVLVVAAALAVFRLRAERDLLASEMATDQRRFGHVLATMLERSGNRHVDGLAAAARRFDVTVRLEPLAQLDRAARGYVRRGRDWTLTSPSTMTTWVPFRHDGRVVAALAVVEPLTDLDAFKAASAWQTFEATTASLLVTIALVFGTSALFVGRPLGLLVRHSRRVAAGDLTVRTNLRQRDEVGDLAREMNGMTERLDESRRNLDAETRARVATLEQLRHADRLRTVGQIASGLAHELGTPLNVVVGHAQLIASSDASAETVGSAKVIEEQTKRMTALVKQLLTYARRGQPRRERIDLAEQAESVVRLLSAVAKKKGVELQTDACDGSTPTLADATQVQQALTNLVMNAIDASPRSGTVWLRVGTEPAVAPDETSALREMSFVEVEDAGAGIAPGDLGRVFEPFFTTKATGEGTGLGLPLVAGIARDHDGWIDVDSQLGRGSRFRLYLPTTAPDDVR